ncbi:MAG: 16S rRNA (cytosine(1402)-N(4))-methyltransferase RsmH [Flavobacteriales bacterium]|jgi:16S rRNA (cytosine1402-N4)-methyltransferase|nr:16S rRNA (cytosine(1402)-N(4))-methyltransferase RsmH [Flavobacteriales bacterium]|tara:strand:- start:6530 stop:7429 length:900 start_codon:yes stop_codon:yes gene_type:complete
MAYHKAVLLDESIAGLSIDPNGTYVDVTFGGGGHSKSILDQLENGKLFAFDQDSDAQQNRIEDNRLVLIAQNFRFIKKWLRLEGINEVDGILADLGVSSHQFDTAERGFSIREEGELDMRMNRQQNTSAKTIVNEYDVNDLSRIFRQFGELNNAYSLAKSIVSFREEKEIETTEDLKEAVKNHVPPHKKNKILAQLFQAIRIEVNDEINALKEMLIQSVDLLKKGGRLSVISYHSLEDRLVKNLIKSGNFEGEIEKDLYGVPNLTLKSINRKPITASQEEIDGNPRSRSAKLRVGEKIA